MTGSGTALLGMWIVGTVRTTVAQAGIKDSRHGIVMIGCCLKVETGLHLLLVGSCKDRPRWFQRLGEAAYSTAEDWRVRVWCPQQVPRRCPTASRSSGGLSMSLSAPRYPYSRGRYPYSYEYSYPARTCEYEV